MKKLKKKVSAVLLASAVALTTLISAAAAEPFTAKVENAINAKNSEQSWSIEFTEFDATRMTKDSVITVTYEVVEDKGGDKKVELVAQKYPDEQRKDYKGDSAKVKSGEDALWKIVEADTDDGKGKATFKYSSIVSAFGYDDFTILDKINVEAASESTIKCTGFQVSNVLSEKDGKHPTVNSGIAWYWIVIAVVAAVGVVIAIVFIILNKKSDKAFDVTTGEYIDKKKV